jgi:hypothetical protein
MLVRRAARLRKTLGTEKTYIGCAALETEMGRASPMAEFLNSVRARKRSSSDGSPGIGTSSALFFMR